MGFDYVFDLSLDIKTKFVNKSINAYDASNKYLVFTNEFDITRICNNICSKRYI